MRFGAGFHLNKTTRFRKNSVVSSTVHKKKSLKRCRFKWHCGSSSSPGRASQGKKKIFFSPGFFSLFLRKHQKDVDHNPTCINSDLWPTTGRWKTEGTHPLDGPGEAEQWPPLPSLPLFLPINIGEESKKNNRRGDALMSEGKEKKEKKSEDPKKKTRKGERAEKKIYRRREEKHRREERKTAA